MKLYKLIIIISLLFISSFEKINAEQIVYINMEKIMKASIAGKQIIDKIAKSNEKNINKFKNIENDLIKQEQDLISKKNVLSENEFKSKLENLKKKISE